MESLTGINESIDSIQPRRPGDLELVVLDVSETRRPDSCAFMLKFFYFLNKVC